jgi:poly-gamma-glutamate synthesis protein (capsule biosynthesis protein)
MPENNKQFVSYLAVVFTVVAFLSAPVLGYLGARFAYYSLGYEDVGVPAAENETAGREKNAPTRIESRKIETNDRVFPADESDYAIKNTVLADQELTIPEKGKFIKADLENMTIGLFENGLDVGSYKIVSIGRKGTPWETPVGLYRVLSKEEKHFSSIGSVWMPWSIQFFGNYFLHGWPYYSGGAPVAKGYSGGCIRMETGDAKRVYEFADNNTPIAVIFGENEDLPFVVSSKPYFFLKNKKSFPAVSASSYLIADIGTGLVIKEKNSGSKYPIASVTKLMTALVSLEAINQYLPVTVSKTAVETYGDAGLLKAGDKLAVSDLLYPLLLSSSNDAATALAEQMGLGRFVSLMNEKSRSIGLSDTSFDDPSGLDSDNVSTAEDLFRLARYIYHSKNYILKITQKKEHKIEEAGGAPLYHWYNTNKILLNDGFLGGKNGYTPEARETSVSLFTVKLGEFSERNIAIVVLSSERREEDVAAMLNWVKSEVYYSEEVALGENKISVLFAGDIMLGRGVEASVARNGGDFSFLFEKTQPVKNADIAFGNLEGPVSDKGQDLKNLYSFRFATSSLEALSMAGFDVLSVANNHVGDWGREAFDDTLSRLNEKNILAAGGGFDLESASGPVVVEKKGVKFGFLAFSDVGPNWLEAKATSSGILIYDEKTFSSIVGKASRACDALFVSLHFGDEYKEKPDDRQKKIARKAIDAGAKVVAGHHPHVVQDLEYYKKGVIAYSLGNFVFDQNFSGETMSGLVLELVFSGKDIISVKKYDVKINNKFQAEIKENNQ